MDGIDLTDLDNFADGFPTSCSTSTVAWRPCGGTQPTEHTPDGEGFWSVATHAETLQVLRNADVYSSERGGDRPSAAP